MIKLNIKKHYLAFNIIFIGGGADSLPAGADSQRGGPPLGISGVGKRPAAPPLCTVHGTLNSYKQSRIYRDYDKDEEDRI